MIPSTNSTSRTRTRSQYRSEDAAIQLLTKFQDVGNQPLTRSAQKKLQAIEDQLGTQQAAHFLAEQMRGNPVNATPPFNLACNLEAALNVIKGSLTLQSAMQSKMPGAPRLATHGSGGKKKGGGPKTGKMVAHAQDLTNQLVGDSSSSGEDKGEERSGAGEVHAGG